MFLHAIDISFWISTSLSTTLNSLLSSSLIFNPYLADQVKRSWTAASYVRRSRKLFDVESTPSNEMAALEGRSGNENEDDNNNNNNQNEDDEENEKQAVHEFMNLLFCALAKGSVPSAHTPLSLRGHCVDQVNTTRSSRGQ